MAVEAYRRRRITLAPGMEICWLVRESNKWEVDPARTASEFDAGYYGGLLEKAWTEAAFVFGRARDDVGW